ncbi:MAG: hypothetical protein ACI8XO_002574 [Verrucomicrobiales bacterium]|jgi:hypothetical protein
MRSGNLAVPVARRNFDFKIEAVLLWVFVLGNAVGMLTRIKFCETSIPMWCP